MWVAMLGNHSPLPAWRNNDRGGCSVCVVGHGHDVPCKASLYSSLTDCESQSSPDIATVFVMMNILGSEDCASHVRILSDCIAMPLRTQRIDGPFHHATELLN